MKLALSVEALAGRIGMSVPAMLAALAEVGVDNPQPGDVVGKEDLQRLQAYLMKKKAVVHDGGVSAVAPSKTLSLSPKIKVEKKPSGAAKEKGAEVVNAVKSEREPSSAKGMNEPSVPQQEVKKVSKPVDGKGKSIRVPEVITVKLLLSVLGCRRCSY